MQRFLQTAAAVMCCAHMAHADVIASSSGGDDGFASSTPSNINSSGGIPPFPLSIAADSFATTSGGTVESVTFWGRTAQINAPLSGITSFRLRVFEDDAGAPGAIVTDQSVSVFQFTTTPDGPVTFYRYDVDTTGSSLTSFELDPATVYWLSVAANKSFNNTTPQWTWQFSPDRDGVQVRTQGSPSGAWNEVFGDEIAVAFRLEGTLAPPPCPGDVDGDGSTDLTDFTALAANFGASGLPFGDGESRTLGDLNDDGNVDLSDFTILASDFGCSS
ncbi:MAG: dockerin type I domain-containing protein [Planctomycetota bacterium]